jgi:hypothetical protein
MQQDRHLELINHLDLAMIPERGKPAVVDFAVILSRLWNVPGEDEWHASGPPTSYLWQNPAC